MMNSYVIYYRNLQETMASSSSFRHVIECPVCLVKYALPDRVPKNLGCGHTFCVCCLRELASADTIKCPTCRTEFGVPDGGVEGNYVNFICLKNNLENIVSKRKKKKINRCNKTNKNVKKKHKLKKKYIKHLCDVVSSNPITDSSSSPLYSNHNSQYTDAKKAQQKLE
jgi:hypothetical protein